MIKKSLVFFIAIALVLISSRVRARELVQTTYDSRRGSEGGDLKKIDYGIAKPVYGSSGPDEENGEVDRIPPFGGGPGPVIIHHKPHHWHHGHPGYGHPEYAVEENVQVDRFPPFGGGHGPVVTHPWHPGHGHPNFEAGVGVQPSP
ncbi:hypothetical protein M569_15908 [Genlisea aurea]|uniref:Glycine-rich protein n=1 Tax=Genlisea aurea TaxID=192259 RepID=S8BX40_9LAMI|nr:hypothetical protein M569_15908 [Genlisea aurea]